MGDMGMLDVKELTEALQKVVNDLVRRAVSAAETELEENSDTARLSLVDTGDDDLKSNDGDAGSDDDDETEVPPLTSRERRLAALDAVNESVSSVFSSLVADFRGRRNKYCILERLTDELLSHILLFAVDGEPATSKFLMSHVSRRWRNMFLKDSRLWTSINFLEPKPFVDECLVRAGKAPLDIKYPWVFDGAADFRTDIVQVFLDRLDQIHSFSINVPSENHLLGASFLSHSLPVAAAVSVLVIADAWGSIPVGPGPVIDDLFESNAPRLHYLSIERFGLPWNLHKFTNLKSLSLDKCYFINPLPENDFLTMLSSLPALRQLSLVDVQNLCWHGIPRYDEHPIELSQLRIIRLDGLRLRDTVAILSSIKAPHDLRLSVKVRFDENEPVTPLTSLRLYDRLPSLDTLRDLMVDLGHSNFQTFESVSLTGAAVKNGHNKNFILGLSGNGQQFATQIFPSACDPFDFSRLKRLTINWRMHGWSLTVLEAHPPHDAVQDLVYFLNRCPDLEILQLTGWLTPREILSALYEDPYGNVPCPKVTVLNLEHSTFLDENLKDLIRRRPLTKCARIRSICLRGSYQFTPKTVEWLRERVDEVIWDGESNEINAFDPFPL